MRARSTLRARVVFPVPAPPFMRRELEFRPRDLSSSEGTLTSVVGNRTLAEAHRHLERVGLLAAIYQNDGGFLGSAGLESRVGRFGSRRRLRRPIPAGASRPGSGISAAPFHRFPARKVVPIVTVEYVSLLKMDLLSAGATGPEHRRVGRDPGQGDQDGGGHP